MEIGKREVEATLPLWLQTEMCYSDADRTILDELRKCAQAQTRKLEIESGIEPLKQSIDQITEQLAVVQEYVTVSFFRKHETSRVVGLHKSINILIVVSKILLREYNYYFLFVMSVFYKEELARFSDQRL